MDITRIIDCMKRIGNTVVVMLVIMSMILSMAACGADTECLAEPETTPTAEATESDEDENCSKDNEEYCYPDENEYTNSEDNNGEGESNTGENNGADSNGQTLDDGNDSASTDTANTPRPNTTNANNSNNNAVTQRPPVQQTTRPPVATTPRPQTQSPTQAPTTAPPTATPQPVFNPRSFYNYAMAYGRSVGLIHLRELNTIHDTAWGAPQNLWTSLTEEQMKANIRSRFDRLVRESMTHFGLYLERQPNGSYRLYIMYA